MKQSQPAKGTTKNTVTTQNKTKTSSQSDPGNQTIKGFNVKQANGESRQYSNGHQTSDLTMLGPVSSLSNQMVHGYQPGEVSNPDLIKQV
ncbi:hypothetical protein DPMN_066722 [Dreissena polymorpha]|uniref:Uncharacterized protein n=1 Tax=Dreissena polymorpha TaxID=45954 RepID=A0A9D3YXY2_DREPO|nr:hypothetical protein DPMN_066722 [Dreissena polymorpha]